MFLLAIKPTLEMGVSFIKPMFLAVSNSAVQTVWHKNIHGPRQHTDNRSSKISSATMRQHMHQVPTYETRVARSRYQSQRWGHIPLPRHRLENCCPPQCLSRHIFETHTVSVCMTMGTNVLFEMSTCCPVSFSLKRMVPSQTQKNQEKPLPRTCLNAIRVSLESRLCTLFQKFVNDNVASHRALVEPGIHFVRT